MASEGAVSRRPPLAPPPKRRAASGDHHPSNVLTYKRRRGKSNSISGSDPKTTDQMNLVAAPSRNPQQPGHQPLARHWRSWRATLEGFLQSPTMSQGPGGIQSCILDALSYNGCQPLQQLPLPVTEERHLANGYGQAKESPSSGPRHGQQNNNNFSLVPFEDGTVAYLEANKAMCNNALFNILLSEKFALLCDSLASIFHINKPDEVIGLANIDVRMRNGDYAHNPKLFNHDINQIWEKFEQIGRGMVDLASSLSVISRASYQKQASGISETDITEHKTEETSLVGVAHKTQRESTSTQLTPCDSGDSTIPKRIGTTRLHGVQNCKDCCKNADDEGRIICNGCEGTYHISCLNLDLEDVPVKWLCPACIESALVAIKNNNDGKMNEDRNVCEWVDNINPLTYITIFVHFAIKNNNDGKMNEDRNVCEWVDIIKPKEDPEAVSGTQLAAETQESAVASMEEESEPDLSATALSNLCKHCGTCEDEDKKFLVCGHPYCIYKFYHIRCLKEGQIAKEKQKDRACWYCPSCLCRGCFEDMDDEYTVLCDGCDDAYHIYCMKPSHTCIPKGQWYCASCSMLRSTEGLQKSEKSILQGVKKNIRDAKKAQTVCS